MCRVCSVCAVVLPCYSTRHAVATICWPLATARILCVQELATCSRLLPSYDLFWTSLLLRETKVPYRGTSEPTSYSRSKMT